MLLGIRAKIRNGALLKWREERGMSQADAALVAGVSPTFWNCVECLRFDESVHLDGLIKVAACVESTVEDIWPESLRGKKIETQRTAYRQANPERMLSECSRVELAMLPAPDINLSDPIDAEDLRRAIDGAMEALTYREQTVLNLRFGLDGVGPLTYEECGKVLKVTRERIRQVETKAITKIAGRYPGLNPLKRFVNR